MMSIDLPIVECKRCGHKWTPRQTTLPKRCPSCISPYWNKDRIVRERREEAAESREKAS